MPNIVIEYPWYGTMAILDECPGLIMYWLTMKSLVKVIRDDVLGKPCGTLHSFPFSRISFGARKSFLENVRHKKSLIFVFVWKYKKSEFITLFIIFLKTIRSFNIHVRLPRVFRGSVSLPFDLKSKCCAFAYVEECGAILWSIIEWTKKVSSS